MIGGRKMINKAVIITAFLNYDYDVRIKYLERYLLDKGIDVTIITTDWNHREKIPFYVNKDNVEYIHVISYKRNMSVARIASHVSFASKLINVIEKMEPDLIYAIIPPNFLVRKLYSYKQQHSDTKLIYEVEDLWPESIPLDNRLKKQLSIIFNIWSGLRDKWLINGDYFIFECELLKNKVKGYQRNKSTLIYLTKDGNHNGIIEKDLEKGINLLYLGSINNIIDINLITELASEMSLYTPTCLQIIGDGEARNQLLQKCKDMNIVYIYHGIILDEEKKNVILSRCHYGLNIMKNTVEVGVTMKSLDYFFCGLPLINNIKGDTYDIIESERCGINVLDVKKTARKIC